MILFNVPWHTLIAYGGICLIPCDPVDEPEGADVRARLIEITPDKDIVFDMCIGGGPSDPRALFVFRSEFVPVNVKRLSSAFRRPCFLWTEWKIFSLLASLRRNSVSA